MNFDPAAGRVRVVRSGNKRRVFRLFSPLPDCCKVTETDSKEIKELKRIALIFTILLFSVISTLAQAAPTAPTITLKVGEEAPDFMLPDTAGNKVKLSDFRGKKNVVLAFFVLAFTGG